MSKLKDFLTRNIGNPIEGIANTALSLIRDKTRDPEQSFIRDKVRKGVSISSKRVLNLVGTTAIITAALGDMALNGISWPNIAVLGIGVVYAIIMAKITPSAVEHRNNAPE